MSDRVLVCDDDACDVRALRGVLRDAGFRVDVTTSAGAALDSAALRMPSVAIVESALPDGDGVELCRQLREWSPIPILVLSALDDEHHKVRALDAGADDYVTKPFAPPELVARVRARLRRSRGETAEQRIEVAGLTVDFARRAVYRGGEAIHLTPIEFKLLGLLLRDHGRLLTHQSLLRQVWGPGWVDDTPTLRTHIANLRRKIALPYIRTLHGVGYRLEVPRPVALVIEDAEERGRAPKLGAA